MRKVFLPTLFVLTAIALSTVAAWAQGLSPKDAAVLKGAGIPVYQGAKYINGQLGGISGVRFVSSADLEEVRAFYRSALPGWALNSQYGTWILYNGKPGGGPATYMNKQQVMVVKNMKLSSMFGLDKEMTTEIMIVVPQ